MSHIPISLYIHTPWCLHKCPYCDFNSHAIKTALPEETYITALLEDFKEQLPLLQGRTLQTIFIGGGTPSLFSPKSYARLLEELNHLTPLISTTEITIEANPGTLEQGRFQGYRAIGINRLSMGVQSFQNEKLKSLQRIHNADEAKRAIQSAKESGFDNFNIDLMFGLPEQSIQDGLYDLQTAIDLKPSHISWYQLTLEPNTFFYHKPPPLPSDEKIWALQLQGQKLLKNHGYKHYEVSAYSLPHTQCQHNRNYWLYGDYIGIGAGAHGKITDFDSQQIIRRWNHKNPKDYLNPDKSVLSGQQIIHPEERSLEFMINALRLQETIPLSLFEERTALSATTIATSLNTAQKQGLLTWDLKKIKLTQRGHHYLNELLALF